MNYDEDFYTSVCHICGIVSEFARTSRAIRETYSCPRCRGLLREREHARVFVNFISRGACQHLSQFVGTPQAKDLSIYEPGTAGAMRPFLRTLGGHVESDFIADEGARASAGERHQDLCRLTFASRTFDVVLSSDILEHVRRPLEAFAEIFRVLKPGGVTVFTVPLQEPLSALSVWRVDTSGPEDRPLLEPHYHGDGKGGRSLVYVDFGRDIADMLTSVGFAVRLVGGQAESSIARRVVTVLAVRPE